MKKILETIKQKRLFKGLSQAVMGRRLNMVSSAYGKIERGQTELTLKRLIQICEVLELNYIELSKNLNKAKENLFGIKKQMNTENNTTSEPELSRKLNYIFTMLINSMVEEKYTEIMRDYPYEEFTAEDLWNSLGDNKEEQLGITESEFRDMYEGSYQEIFKPEDEYSGFEKLMTNSTFFYFFKFGIIENTHLNQLFKQYLSTKDTKCYPLDINSNLKSSTISEYIKTLTEIDVFEPQNDILEQL